MTDLHRPSNLAEKANHLHSLIRAALTIADDLDAPEITRTGLRALLEEIESQADTLALNTSAVEKISTPTSL